MILYPIENKWVVMFVVNVKKATLQTFEHEVMTLEEPLLFGYAYYFQGSTIPVSVLFSDSTIDLRLKKIVWISYHG